MKKVLTFLVVCLIALVGYTQEIATYRDIAKILQGYNYISDGNTDYWQTPEETIARRGGDCEDFAILINDWLDACGYQSNIYLISTNLWHHAVTIFKDEYGNYHAFSNYQLLPYTTESVNDLFSLLWRGSTAAYPNIKLKGIWLVEPVNYGYVTWKDKQKSYITKVY